MGALRSWRDLHLHCLQLCALPTHKMCSSLHASSEDHRMLPSTSQRRPRRQVQSSQIPSPMIRLDSIVWVPSWRCPALSKMRTRRLPRKGGTMRQDCRLPCSTLGAGLSVSLTMSVPFVTRPHRSDVAGRHGASKSAEPPCTRVGVVGTVVLLEVALGEVAPGEAVLGPSIQGGARAPSVGLTTWACSVTAITRCIAATTMGISWSALLARSHPGGVDE